jgi:hypothetical protein
MEKEEETWVRLRPAVDPCSCRVKDARFGEDAIRRFPFSSRGGEVDF